GDATFQLGGPNYTLTAADFPLHRLANVNDRQSTVLSDSNDVISSAGIFNHTFRGIVAGSAADECVVTEDPVFNVGRVNTRRVEPRNAPTVINAVYNFRNFWDGRANNDFNGVNPFGPRDPEAAVWKTENGALQPIRVAIPLSSLASQAVGPPNSRFEMSCDQRTFPDIGRKLLAADLVPLAKQLVAPNDGVLGPMARSRLDPAQRGLQTSYPALVRQAFSPAYWSSPDAITLGEARYSQMEANFSLFFGLAVQLYEATLIANDTPFDQFMDGNTSALTAQQQRGMTIFAGQGRCALCHGSAELSNAAVSNVSSQRLERMAIGNGELATYDNGFYNIGVRPSAEDLGVGGSDPFGNPLSETGFCRQQLQRGLPCPAELANLGARPDEGLGQALLGPTGRIAVHGNFKTAQLRNIELTAPYFHNGGAATLRQVVQFYNRGGDFADQNRDDLDPDIGPIGLSEAQIDDLVAFLTSLTDERVRFDRAPFDHPELFVPNGHPGDEFSVTDDGTGEAVDEVLHVP
ncbi:MAG TPA: cytochrome c peroxidase, partial [Chloroflexota bacterium]|nr:cytochrome c peroxidase [Chloroflexota bacterium]